MKKLMRNLTVLALLIGLTVNSGVAAVGIGIGIGKGIGNTPIGDERDNKDDPAIGWKY